MFLKTGSISPYSTLSWPFFPLFLVAALFSLWRRRTWSGSVALELHVSLISSWDLWRGIISIFNSIFEILWSQSFPVFGTGAVTYLHAWELIFLYWVYCIIKCNTRNHAYVRIGLPFLTGLVFLKQNNCSQKCVFLPHQASILFDTLFILWESKNHF